MPLLCSHLIIYACCLSAKRLSLYLRPALPLAAFPCYPTLPPNPSPPSGESSSAPEPDRTADSRVLKSHTQTPSQFLGPPTTTTPNPPQTTTIAARLRPRAGPEPLLTIDRAGCLCRAGVPLLCPASTNELLLELWHESPPRALTNLQLTTTRDISINPHDVSCLRQLLVTGNLPNNYADLRHGSRARRRDNDANDSDVQSGPVT